MLKGLKSNPKEKGFTLVELLVVLAIIATLGAIAIVLINPQEIQKRNRDSQRLIDMPNLKAAITLALQESSSPGGNVLCNGATPPGQSCMGDSTTDSRNSNGTGWLKVDISNLKGISMSVLPIDPLNLGQYKYTYKTNTPAAGSFPDKWEIDTVLESTYYQSKMEQDGGDNNSVYETGTDLQIIH